MAVIYSDDWCRDLMALVNGSDAFARRAPRGAVVMALEVIGDRTSPYVPAGSASHYLLRLEDGKVRDLHAVGAPPASEGLHFRFTAPATIWETIAAGLLDPITAGLRGQIRIRGDVRFLMQNADAVKILVDLYAAQGSTDWPAGRPPYVART
jgi:hypothetical protein